MAILQFAIIALRKRRKIMKTQGKTDMAQQTARQMIPIDQDDDRDDEVTDFARNHPEAADFLRLHSELKKANTEGRASMDSLQRDFHLMTVRAEYAERELSHTRDLLAAEQRARFALQAHMEITAQTAIAGLAAAKNEAGPGVDHRQDCAAAAVTQPVIQFGRPEGDAITGGEPDAQ